MIDRTSTCSSATSVCLTTTSPTRLTALLRKLDIPAVALRSYGGVEPPEDLVAIGFVDHIDKPIDLNALSAVIARFASRHAE